MKLTNVEKKENSVVELSVLVEKDEFEAAVEKAYRQNVGKISVEGFRKGKAPRKIIERYYGKGVFYEDAMNICYPEAFEKAIKEAGYIPVDQPALTDLDIKDGEFTFKAVVAVKPEVKIGEYKGMEAERAEAKVTDEEVEAELNRLVDRNSRIQDVDREAREGDDLIFDFDGYVDGKPMPEGGSAKGFNYKVGVTQFIPGFEEQILGHKAEEPFDVNVTFPADYGEASLQGKDATFKCVIHNVREVIKPAVDDEFAKDVSEFDTLDELKASLRSELTNRAQKSLDSDFENELMNKLSSAVEADIPPVMYEQQLDQIVQNFNYRLSYQGMDINKYLEVSNTTMEDFRKLFKPQAESQVKTRLALEKIAELENIEVSDEDVEAEFKKIADQNYIPLDQVKNYINREDLISDIKVERASRIVIDNAKALPVSKKEEKKPAAKKSTSKKTAAASEAPSEEKPKAKKSTKKAEPAPAEAAEQPAEEKPKKTAKKAKEEKAE